MKTVAFHIEKGGTGKTTMSGNTAFEIRHYKKTVLVDCDPQGNLTSWFADTLQADLSDVLQQKVPLRDALLRIRDNLWFIPTAAIDGDLKEWTQANPVEADRAIEYLIRDLENEGFEIAVFDLGPGISNLEKSVLSLMDEIIGVVSAEYFGMDGIEIFENELEKLRRQRRCRFLADKLVVNRLNRSYSAHNIYREQFEKLSYELFTVGQTTALSDCVPAHQSLFEFDPGNKHTSEIQRLAAALVRG